MMHTKEPWFVGETTHENGEFIETAIMALGGEASPAVCLDFGFNNLGMRDANSKRIVACVNACAGISTENLEENVPLIEAVRKMNVAVKQRDTAWEEGRKIRDVIKANPEESTFDEVERVVAERSDLLVALTWLLENTEEPPLRNCSCHISPPCNDCVDFSGLREVIANSKAIIAKVEGKS